MTKKYPKWESALNKYIEVLHQKGIVLAVKNEKKKFLHAIDLEFEYNKNRRSLCDVCGKNLSKDELDKINWADDHWIVCFKHEEQRLPFQRIFIDGNKEYSLSIRSSYYFSFATSLPNFSHWEREFRNIFCNVCGCPVKPEDYCISPYFFCFTCQQHERYRYSLLGLDFNDGFFAGKKKEIERIASLPKNCSVEENKTSFEKTYQL